MKNSGIEWIGNIPNDWGCIKSKYVAITYTGNSIKDDEKSLYENPTDAIPYIATKNIDVNTAQIDKTDILFIKNTDKSFVRASSKDILMCVEGGSAGRKKTFLNEDVCFVNKLCCFHSININPKYLYYIMSSPHYESEFNLNITGLIGGVSRSKLDNFILPNPTRELQRDIVKYLDEKCGKINELIANQEKQIEKLKEYKQSVITEAVTKGLDKSVPMKDSGIEWIGKIPAHWGIKRAKFIANSFSKGSGITKEDIVVEGDSPCVRYGEIYTKYDGSFDECFTRTNLNKVSSPQYFSYGDILFVCTGELVEEIGKNVVYLGKDNCLAGGDIIVMKHKQNPLYLSYTLNSYISQCQKSCNKAKLKVVHISAGDVGNVFIAIPSIEEQANIANFLKVKCDGIDRLIAIKQEKIEKLQEYKKSLIYEYVTGKKEVV